MNPSRQRERHARFRDTLAAMPYFETWETEEPTDLYNADHLQSMFEAGLSTVGILPTPETKTKRKYVFYAILAQPEKPRF